MEKYWLSRVHTTKVDFRVGVWSGFYAHRRADKIYFSSGSVRQALIIIH